MSDKLALRAYLECLGLKEKQEHQAPKDLRVYRALGASQVYQAPRVRRVWLDKTECPGLLAKRGHRETPDLQVHPVSRDHVEHQA